MPLAVLKGRDHLVGDEDLRAVAGDLRVAIAAALDCTDEGGGLKADHVEVEFRPDHPFDTDAYDLRLTVIANEFPSRRADLDERREKIQEAFKASLTKAGFCGLYACVWVMLVPASFGRFGLEEAFRDEGDR